MAIMAMSLFTKRFQEIFAHDDYWELQHFFVDNPATGEPIKGGSGLKKPGWQVSGQGNRGGSRITYYLITSQNTICMLLIFQKLNRLTRLIGT